MSTTMGTLSAVLFLGASLATPVAAKDLAASLQGKWRVDKEALYKSNPAPFYKTATPEMQKDMLAAAMKWMPDMFFEFTADTVSVKAGDEVHPASLKVTKTEKSTVFFDTVDKKKPGSPPDKMSAEFLDDNTIKLSSISTKGDVYVLKRAK